ncbi:MAG: hypothetical protein DSY66_06095 [Persephonella sp.]|nr:MAG: hypothetical protein DSY66_06095 [Persephonella sp.]RUM59995.1 MAG: hypothetical protein DSY53_01565 [Persephonella sp.]
MDTSQELRRLFNELKLKRKNGEISEKDYYISLLQLSKRVIDSLEEENISGEDIKKQIPLIVLFIDEQINNFAKRGN